MHHKTLLLFSVNKSKSKTSMWVVLSIRVAVILISCPFFALLLDNFECKSYVHALDRACTVFVMMIHSDCFPIH